MSAFREETETLLDEVLLDWATLSGEKRDRFGQQVKNGMFHMIADVSVLLCALEWECGPHRRALWQYRLPRARVVPRGGTALASFGGVPVHSVSKLFERFLHRGLRQRTECVACEPSDLVV